MSYPYQYDPNHCDNNLINSIPNNQTGTLNSELNSQCNTFYPHSYGGVPTPISYQNHPNNVIFPPMDFSVPPPNFQSQNLNAHFNQFVRTLPPVMPTVQSSNKDNSTENIFQNIQCARSNNSNRDINENTQRNNKSSSVRRNNVSSPVNRSQRFRTRSRSKETDRNHRNQDRNRDMDWQRRSPRRDQFSSRNDVRHSNYKRNEEQKRDRDRHSSRSSSLHSNRSRSRRDDIPSRSSTRSRCSRTSRPPDIRRSSRSKTTPPVKCDNDRELRVEPELKQSVCKKTERAMILEKWRSNFCETSEDIARKLEEMTENTDSECWIRSSPADLFYKRTSSNEMEGTSRSETLCTLFDSELIERGQKARITKPAIDQQPKKRKHRVCRHKSDKCSSSDSSDDDFNIEDDCRAMDFFTELTKKIQHPYRLHVDLWHNEPGEMNDGPLCRCSAKSRRSGIRHGIYPGETGPPKCNPSSNNAGKLYHYKITVSPPTNFLTKTPTMIKHDQHEFLFEGFSLLSHSPIAELPTCSVIRFNIEYKIMYFEEKMPENFTVRELDLFYNYLFVEILEMLDFSLVPKGNNDACPCFHFLPRFVRDLPDNGKEILAMSEVLRYLLDNSGPLVSETVLENMQTLNQHDWQDYVDDVKGMVVINPGMKPCSIRVDQLDRNVTDLSECVDPDDPNIIHPIIVHFGVRPPQLSYAGNPEYQKSWREYVKFRHLVANMSKPSFEDKRKLESKECRLQEMRTQGRMKRNVTVAIVSKNFYRTGIMCDIVQHALLIPVLTTHLRFHQSLDLLEKNIDYKFKNRYLLQLALTHPSYKENYGTNPDHARNSLTNCGVRQPEYGDRKIHYLNTRKRGINTLINIMSRFGKEDETDSNITHNERLEFLGDAVVEFLTSIHLFFMFPDLEEGGLATYRAAIVQNQHLAVLAKKLRLDEFMLYAHGSDLCHELELRHAMANCFEALMGALLLDGGIDVADKIWINYPPHPLQEQEPLGDRQWIESYPLLKDLTKFEESVGISFKHIRLLARAFTDRSIGFTNLTLGSNQRLEFLGDTVLQLICSEYLYRHFPEHHEGHLSLLRSSLVNNRTQAVVCDDLGMTKYAIYSNPKNELKTKDRADLLEAFLGSLYVDKGLLFAETFCQVCLFPRLQLFIMNQDWNDPKSKLQQCCLTLRTMDGGEPDIPIYKVIECTGPTNTRVYKVAVYFRGKRLASSTGHSIQQAEMEAAKKALENSCELFPQLDYQKRVMAHSIKRQRGKDGDNDRNSSRSEDRLNFRGNFEDDDSNLPKQYRTRGKISSDNSSSSDSDQSEKTIACSHNSSMKMKTISTKLYQHTSDDSSDTDDSKSNNKILPSAQYSLPLNEEDLEVDRNVTDSSLESGEIT
uniref:Ribonuclease 3 n=1 Tax=Mayetiola destructor TaxID=39758 RepID=K7YZ60_MAYDE|nr:drosha [Mayetiola destructor]